MDDVDIEYYRRRLQQEMLAAEHAADRCCRRVHLELARRYELRVAEGIRFQTNTVEAVVRTRSISIERYSSRFASSGDCEGELL